MWKPRAPVALCAMDPYEPTARHILTSYRMWAVIGCSPNPARESHRVAAFLQSKGFRIIPIYPSAEEILGERAYPNLASVPAPVEVVDIFRRADQAGVHVDEAIEIGAKAVWMQLHVIDEDAAARASDAGLHVVMNRCPKIEYPRLFGR